MIERFVALALCAVVFACAGPSLAAGLSEDVAAQARKAAVELRNAVGLARVDSVAPRIGKPATRALFDQAFPGLAVEGAGADANEFPRLLELSRQAAGLARAYILIGVEAPEGGAIPDSAREKAARNFILFLPEIARLYDFRIGVNARLAKGAADFHAGLPAPLKSDPDVTGGVAAIANEARAAIDAMLAVTGDANIDPGWRIDRLAALGRATPAFAEFLDTKSGQSIADRALALAIAESNASIASMLKNFALAILR